MFQEQPKLSQQLEVASIVASLPSLVDNNINNSHQHVHMLVSVVAAADA